jgi:glyoxylase-like metal-dependent hydrolase (beta-lactamase superfamily II)
MSAITPLAAGLLRLRAANPSPLTGSGTNTYVLGTESLAVIDPGPDDDTHLAAILAATGGRAVSHILVTHAHRDHSALAPRLSAATGAEVLAFGSATDGIRPRLAAVPGLSSSGEGLDLAFTPDRRIADGDKIHGPDWSLRVLHTPGHLASHVCLALGDLLFSGDHVMGWATTIVSPPEGDMGDYMASLDRLGQTAWQRLLPGHGDPVDDPAARIRELADHRQLRARQVLNALADSPATASDLTPRLYQDVPKTLWPAAERNVLAHLIDLEERNLVTAEPFLSAEARFRRL